MACSPWSPSAGRRPLYLRKEWAALVHVSHCLFVGEELLESLSHLGISKLMVRRQQHAHSDPECQTGELYQQQAWLPVNNGEWRRSLHLAPGSTWQHLAAPDSTWRHLAAPGSSLALEGAAARGNVPRKRLAHARAASAATPAESSVAPCARFRLHL